MRKTTQKTHTTPRDFGGPHLDDLLEGDDVPSMPQSHRLLRGQTLVALLHHLQKAETVGRHLLSGIPPKIKQHKGRRGSPPVLPL